MVGIVLAWRHGSLGVYGAVWLPAVAVGLRVLEIFVLDKSGAEASVGRVACVLEDNRRGFVAEAFGLDGLDVVF